jgi:NADH-quinone oxidoreductase subunit E
MFSDEITAQLETIRGRYTVAKAAMVPVLHVIQKQNGWIEADAQKWVAEFLDVTPMEVFEVVTFYPMFYDKPVGRHTIQVCRTLSCDTCGGRELFEHIEAKLGVGRGETTADGRFTLRAAECLASCGTAPAMLIDGERHENLTLDQVDKLLESSK